jgi:hypothetical protein
MTLNVMQPSRQIRARRAGRATALTSLLALFALVACDDQRFMEQPPVQDSASDSPRWRVDVNRLINGVFHSYFPRCFDDARLGHTIEFRNFLPEVPANVTTIAAPAGAELYSPNLVRPYNYVGPEDPDNEVCSEAGGERRCEPYSFWRHSPAEPGVYDWIDTNQGDPGRRVVDPYYGTVTFVGLDPSTPVATFCVRDEGGGGCEAVCCVDDGDCRGNTTCVKSAIEAEGRCVTPGG